MTQGINSFWRIRCVTCGKVLGPLEFQYGEILDQTGSHKDAAIAVGLTRPCCRMQAMSPVILPAGTGLQYESINDTVVNEASRYSRAQQPIVTGIGTDSSVSTDGPVRSSMSNKQIAPGALIGHIIIAGKPVPPDLRPRIFYAR